MRVAYGQCKQTYTLQAHGLGEYPLDDFLHVLKQLLAQRVFASSFHDQRDCKDQLQHACLVVHYRVSTRHSALHQARPRRCFDEREQHLGVAQHLIHVQNGVHDALLLVPYVNQSERFLLGDGPYWILVCVERRLWYERVRERW